mmetsp:Transcript_8057/g.9723  ORF Transcript_8057/g.9723 Transcript_8057/m.9723 type:complete len:251 (-) Transcript_8057:631-1383(-)
MTPSISSQYNNRQVSRLLNMTLLCLFSSSFLFLEGTTRSSTVFGVEAYMTIRTPEKYFRCTTNIDQSSRKCISDMHRQRLITTYNRASFETEVTTPPPQKRNINVVETHLWKRMDTLRFAGFPPTTTKMDDGQQTKNHPMAATISGAAILLHSNSSSVSSSLRLGFWGHSGLLLVSTLVVTLLKKVFSFSSAEVQQEQQQAGILNRCPWPFIFFHDVKQGMKDTPTWITLTWIGLWRLLKFAGRAKPTVV